MRKKIYAFFAMAMAVTMLFQYAPAAKSFAKEIADPADVAYDENGNLNVENQSELESLIEQAKALGVNVNVTDETKDAVYAGDAGAVQAAETEIIQHNNEEIEKIKAAIEEQKQYNEEYYNVLEAGFKPIIGSEWTTDQFGTFLLSGDDQAKAEDERLKIMADIMGETSVVSSSGETSLVEKSLQNKDWFTVGDYIIYGKVFKDAKTGKWVDLKMTLQSVGPVFDAGVTDKIKWNWISPDKTVFSHNPDDVTIRVDFLDDETKQPVSIVPIVAFVDVDGGQAVQINDEGLVKNVLYGNKITHVTDDVYTNAYKSPDAVDDSTDGGNQGFWVLYSMEKTSGFTYTFYAQRDRNVGVVEGVGGRTIKYEKQNIELKRKVVDVTRTVQPIYHKVTYQFAGDAPDGVTPPADTTQYTINRSLTLAESMTTDSTEKDGKKGEWSFKGWYMDESLKDKVQEHPVTKDEIIYGAWDFVPYTSVTVTKKWAGPKAEGAVIRLLADGTQVDSVTLNAENNWTHIFTDLPGQIDGKDVAYTIAEDEIRNYSTAVTGNAEEGFVVTNTNTETVSIPVTKVWVGLEREKAVVHLLADGEKTDSVEVTADTGWKAKFPPQPKYNADGMEIVYTISEDAVDGYTTGISGSASDGFTVTNTITGRVSVPVTKKWIGEKTESVTVDLYADGEKAGSQKLSKDNNWQYTFADLEKYKDGKEIVYTVKEEDIPGYTAEITGDAQKGYVITNTQIVPPKKDDLEIKHTDKPQKLTAPKTGDSNVMGVYKAMVVFASAAVFVSAVLCGIKKRK